MNLFDALLAIGIVAAAAGIAARNMTAAALLATNAFTIGLDRLGVPFNFVLWIVVDLAAILCIMHPTMTRRDVAVIALFGPAWVLYLVQGEWPTNATKAVVSAQMLLTFPVKRSLAYIRQLTDKIRERDDLKMVAA